LNGRDNGRRRPSRKDRHNQDRRGPPNNPKGDFWGRKPNNRDTQPVKYNKDGVPYERLRWTAPALNTDPLPVPTCTRCGQPITDLHAALTDTQAGGTVHFDCVIAELEKREQLEEGDTLSYVGGGRFGIVRFANPSERKGQRAFTIKRILEWEDKDQRADWRGLIADHYSIT